jgi:hypothetical protein
MGVDVKVIIEVDLDAVAGGVAWEKVDKFLARLRAWGEKAEVEIREKRILSLPPGQETKARSARPRLVTAKTREAVR